MVGPKTAGALGDVIADAMLKVKQATAHHDAHHAQAARAVQLETWEAELAQRWASTFDQFAELIDDDSPLAPMRDVLRTPGHQTDVILMATAIIGIGLGGSFSAAAGVLEGLRVKSLHEFGDLPLPAEVAIMGARRKLIDDGVAADHARYSGIQAHTFELWQHALQSVPSLGELLTMVRRRIIPAGLAEFSLQQLGFDESWAAQLIELVQGPPSTEAAILAEVQNHLDTGAVLEIMTANGIDPGAHDWLYASAGRPPGIEELIKLWRRGVVDRETVAQAIRESDIKNKYVDAILATRRYVPPPRTVMAVFKQGGWDEARARRLLEENGLTPEDADAYVRGAGAHHEAKVHTESQTLVLDAYDLRLLSADQARQVLRDTNHGDAEIDLLLRVADFKRARRLQDEAIGRIRAAYTGWRIDDVKASSDLDALGVPADARDDFMHTWGIERSVATKHLTAAQIGGLFARGKLDEATAITKLRAQGYSDADAQLILDLQSPRPKARPAT